MSSYAVVTAPQTVRIERSLPGPIERVWSYLVDTDKRRSWLAGGTLETQRGGAVDLVFDNGKLTGHEDAPPPKYAAHAGESHLGGRVLECEPPHLLVFTWGTREDPSEVRFELEERGDTVSLVVTHRNLPDNDQMLSVSGGWHAHLDVLAARLDGRAPESFWLAHTRLEAEYAQRLAAPHA